MTLIDRNEGTDRERDRDRDRDRDIGENYPDRDIDRKKRTIPVYCV